MQPNKTMNGEDWKDSKCGMCKNVEVTQSGGTENLRRRYLLKFVQRKGLLKITITEEGIDAKDAIYIPNRGTNYTELQRLL